MEKRLAAKEEELESVRSVRGDVTGQRRRSEVTGFGVTHVDLFGIRLGHSESRLL